MSDLRHLPSVDKLLTQASALIETYGRALTTDAIRVVLDEARSVIRSGDTPPDQAELLSRLAIRLRGWTQTRPRAVINATGVIIHTNLGRAPLSPEAIAAMAAAAAGYSDLEYDLERGARGQRMAAVEDLLQHVTGAEAAFVVNNNAGAALLALSALASGKGALISRGQLVEIGGGFRVPDVMEQSGAKLIEVGTTNRTHRRDYEMALVTQEVATIVRAHSSNFRTVGFTTEVSLAELVELANWKNIPLIDDLGSGALLDTAQYGLAHEPLVQESVAAGAHVICFSGDKLLGGPQAGIIVGQAQYVQPLKKHPLARALRLDKLDLAALSATLVHYLKGEATQKIPVWRMISRSLSEIEQQARTFADQLRSTGFTADVIDGQSTVGGGSLPGETLPTELIALTVNAPDEFLARLRQSDPPVVARIENDRVVFDLRTVLDQSDLQAALRQVT
ncbi:L-seryl-tRNA(Ser) seleniumtransferase [Thermoflexales bacterium]|nr:L-seryl-tRNA(Ser) seleniumtransferase [Thermoflexales bacterium]